LGVVRPTKNPSCEGLFIWNKFYFSLTSAKQKALLNNKAQDRQQYKIIFPRDLVHEIS
jgi:hypothetical protein